MAFEGFQKSASSAPADIPAANAELAHADKSSLAQQFAHGCSEAIEEPLAGLAQLVGYKNAKPEATASKTIAESTGSFAGSAAIFYGAAAALRVLPGAWGEAAPILAGAGLGFLGPTENNSLYQRAKNAFTGAATMTIMEKMPGALGKAGLADDFGGQLIKAAATGVAAGGFDVNAQSLLSTGKLAGWQQTSSAALGWGAMGALFHVGSAGVGEAVQRLSASRETLSGLSGKEKLSPNSFAFLDNRSLPVSKTLSLAPVLEHVPAPAPEQLVMPEVYKDAGGRKFNDAALGHIRWYDRFSIAPRKMPKLNELSKRLGRPSLESELRTDSVVMTKNADGTRTRTELQKHELMRNYPVKNANTIISYPDSFARSLDEVRPWRRVMDEPGADEFLRLPQAIRDRAADLYRAAEDDPKAKSELHTVLTADQIERFDRYLDAYSKIKAHPHGMALLPEELAGLLEELPDARRTRKIVSEDREDPWNEELAILWNAPKFRAAATALPSQKTMILHNWQERGPYGSPDPYLRTRAYIWHEDSHFDDPPNPNWVAAARLEKDGHFTSAHSKRNDAENRAVHHTDFLALDADSFVLLAHGSEPDSTLAKELPEAQRPAPIRTALLARRVEQMLNQADPMNPSPYAGEWRKRIEYTRTHVDSYARADLHRHIQSDDQQTVKDAALLFQSVGTQEDIPNIEAAAVKNLGNGLEQDLLTAAMTISGPTDAAQIRYLATLPERLPQLKDQAVRMLDASGDEHQMGPLLADLLRTHDSLQDGLDVVRQQIASNDFTRKGAIQALGTVGTPEDVHLLNDVVSGNGLFDSRAAAIDALLERLDSDASKFQYLKALAEVNPSMRSQASARMGRLHGGDARLWAQFYEAIGNPDKTPDLLNLSVNMPDALMRNQSFDELMRLTEGHPESQLSMARHVLNRSSAMTAHVLDYLVTHGYSLSGLVNHSMLERAASRASGEAVRPLLKTMLEDPELEPVARRLLGRYNRAIVNHYIRELERQTPQDHLRLNQLRRLDLRPALNRNHWQGMAASDGGSN